MPGALTVKIPRLGISSNGGPHMDTASFSGLRTWLTEAGLAGKSETALLDGFCRCPLDAGLPIARAAILIDTLHPVHEGRAFFWRREAGQTQTELVEYGPTSEGEAAENWRRSEGRMRNPAGYRATGWSPLQTHTPWREGRATRRRCAS